MDLGISRIETPAGTVVMASLGARVCALGFVEQWPALERRLALRWGAIRWCGPAAGSGGVLRYFAGDLAALGAIAIDPGGTPFQRSVWAALSAIPAGETASYGVIAGRIGRPRAARAAGAAIGANPISIIVPCHRAIEKNGGLGGYAGGLDRKRWLLAHERTGARPRAPQAHLPHLPMRNDL